MDSNQQDSGNYNLITIKMAQALQPRFEEKKGTTPYIEFGEKNNYPDYLLDLFNESPKHGAIIKGKANYIFGKGFKDVEQPANITGESWNRVIKKCILDDEIYGGFYLQIIYNLLGKVKDVYHLEFHKVRTNKEKSKFFVKDNWSASNTKEKIREYPAYDGKYNKEQPTCVLYIKQDNPKSNVYSLPNYFQGLNYIECDIQVSRWMLGNAKDGFSAGKLIQFFNGEPTEEQKGQVEKSLKKKLTGSEGDRITIVFSKSQENPVNIADLGSTMLTKEDFTPVNNLIQQEIFACHQVTSPMLFGIKTEGQLGGRSEIQDAYEIFNNTYVNERQQAHEETFNKLFNLVGISGTHLITPVEPLGFTLKEDLLLDVMPREYFMDKLGVDQKYYSLPPTRTSSAPGVTPATTTDASGNVMAVNENLKGMTGKQFQGLERIVRKYKAGKIDRAQAAMLLKSSFGISDEDIAIFLDADSSEQQFASQEEVFMSLYEQFSQVGEDAAGYEVLASKSAREAEYFADVKELTELEANVLALIKKDKRITAEVLAKVLKQKEAVISKVITGLENAGVLTVSAEGERTATSVKVGGDKPTVTEILLRYSYDWRSIVPVTERNTPKHPSRPFCVKMMELNRLYSRADIETISMRLGYSVWDRVGGWWTMPDGEHSPKCRHEWHALTVIRKK